MVLKVLQALQRKNFGHLGLQPFLRLQKLSKYRHRVIEAAANASQWSPARQWDLLVPKAKLESFNHSPQIPSLNSS